MARILIVEDESNLAQGLLFNLKAEGHQVSVEADGEAALETLRRDPFDAVVLDVMLPGKDGFEVATALRADGNYVPILMLTARARSEDVVKGFAAGADDYLPKPFDLSVLLARLNALLRRMQWQRPSESPTTQQTERAPTPTFTLAGHIIDLDNLEIRSQNPQDQPDKIIHLTLMEADLLRYLLDHPGKIVARSELLENVWHVKEDTDTRAIDNFVVRLRRYLEPDPAKPIHLLTIRGVGYRFVPDLS